MRTRHFLIPALATMLLPFGAGGAPATLDPVPRPGPPPTVDFADVRAARDRGVAFLLATQRPDGHWGTPHRTKGLNIMASVPGTHRAFAIASTSLCIEGLMKHRKNRPDVIAALHRAEKWLLLHLPELRRGTKVEVSNTWGHTYSIKALLALRALHKNNPDHQKKLFDAAARQVELLERFEFLNGGWGYYNFGLATKKPAGLPTSFSTASVLIALHQAKEAGIPVSRRIVDRALKSLLMQRFPDGAYAYSFPHRMAPRRGINRPAGSLARSPACNASLRLWTGRKDISDADIIDWLDRLITRGGWLDLARKRPIPHEAFFQNSGYFYYYGQYYGAYCTTLLPKDKRASLRAHLLANMLRLQEKDGSWWDYPLYNYHQAYGTGYALTTLAWLEPRLSK